MKRLFDVAAAGLGLILVSPLLLITAALVRVSSPGPVLFRQTRVGRGGELFTLLKFRTMYTDAEQRGGQLTVGRDPRVTRIGHYLRASKLDELPQLINVVRGDMSLVGPRPEVPRYVALYSEDQRRVLDVRPGITDPASVVYRNESDLMADQSDPESFYVDVLMPEKLRLNLEYQERRTLTSDITVIFDTLKAVVRTDNEPPSST